ncbi:DnaD domain-containing protein [Brevibacillus brevis]|uniref:DnaD domain-containing protein n=1 Tax=Brevibacillus brevis TaxID=1393 RepID=UPI0011594B87|nr:DnaD domain protein [Lysinibacillus sp. SDF0063]TQR29421.1 DnaD domain protein [Lysinibacillus sp. SDF0063]
MNKLLLDEQPLVIIPELARLIGLNEAVVLQQLHYWLRISQHYHDGRHWVYNTYKKWQEQFPFWSEITIRRIFTGLEKQGLLISANYNEMRADNTKWYSIDYEKLQGVIRPPDQNDQAMRSDRSGEPINMIKPIPEITTEITSEREVEKEEPAPPDPFLTYQKEIGVESPFIRESITKWMDEGHFDEPEAIIVEAINLASANGVRKWSYSHSVLNAWASRNIRTLEQARAAIVEHENKKKARDQNSNSTGHRNGKTVLKDNLPESVQWQLEQEKKQAGNQPSDTKSIVDFPDLQKRLEQMRRKR